MDILGTELQELDLIVVRFCPSSVAQTRGGDLRWASSLAVQARLRSAQVASSVHRGGSEIFRTGVAVSTMAHAVFELRCVVVAGSLSTIFKSTSVSTIMWLVLRKDSGRAMLSLSVESLSSIGGALAFREVLKTFTKLFWLLSSAFGLSRSPVKPVVLISSLGAA